MFVTICRDKKTSMLSVKCHNCTRPRVHFRGEQDPIDHYELDVAECHRDFLHFARRMAKRYQAESPWKTLVENLCFLAWECRRSPERIRTDAKTGFVFSFYTDGAEHKSTLQRGPSAITLDGLTRASRKHFFLPRTVDWFFRAMVEYPGSQKDCLGLLGYLYTQSRVHALAYRPSKTE